MNHSPVYQNIDFAHFRHYIVTANMFETYNLFLLNLKF